MRSLNYLLSLVFIILTNCSSINMNNETVEIIGKAQNLKAGAVIFSNNSDNVYYIDGVNYWSKEIIGKTISVKGYLLVNKSNPQKKGDPIKQQITGAKRVIMAPKIKLIDSQD